MRDPVASLIVHSSLAPSRTTWLTTSGSNCPPLIGSFNVPFGCGTIWNSSSRVGRPARSQVQERDEFVGSGVGVDRLPSTTIVASTTVGLAFRPDRRAAT